jgi:NADPH-dependent curcumin reductase CurA
VPGLMRQILVKRLALRGFIISDGFEPRRPDFLDSMSGWLRAGKIKYREDIVEGLENAPSAFLGLLAGRNFGKLVVRVSPDA